MSNDFIWYDEELPDYWSYGVTHDGRVFFINDARHFTTWCHPITRHPVQSGSYEDQNLPRGWQLDFDRSSVPYFINHINQITTLTTPSIPAVRSPPDRYYEYLDSTKMKVDVNPSVRTPQVNPAVVKIPKGPTDMEGWLLRQEGIFKQWKRRWFTMSSNQLHCYKDPNGRQMTASYALSGSTFSPCYGEPGILKTFAFKITQKKKKAVYLAAESLESYDAWKEAFERNANDDDEVFEGGRSPFPHHLAQRSNSISGMRDHTFQQNQSDLDFPHKRSQSYHNLDRSKGPSSRNHDETEGRRGSTDRVVPLQREFSEHRSRLPVYSLDEGALNLPGNYGRQGAKENSPHREMSIRTTDQDFPQGNGTQQADILRNGNLPKEPPLLRQHANSDRNLADRGYVGAGGFPYERHLKADSVGRVNSMAPSPITTQRHNSSYLSNQDENIKTWKSIERSPEDANGNLRLDEERSPRQSASIQFGDRSFVGDNPSHNRSFMKTENPEQLYSKVMKPKGPIPQRSNPVRDGGWSNGPPQRISGSYSGLDSRVPSNRSVLLPTSDNFSSVSKYNSGPSSALGGRVRSGDSMENFYNPSYGIEGVNIGRSVDSLNTLKTNGSSKSSSKNTYYLSSTTALNDNDGVNRGEGPGNNSYYVVENGNNNNFQSSQLQSYSSLTFGQAPNDARSRNNLPRNFSAIKEDPDMPDDQVLSSKNLEDLRRKLASHTRLRLSISVQDLMGKSYEEVVLFLIQLKRSQSELHEMCNSIKRTLDILPQRSVNQVADRRALERQVENTKKQIEATQPLINLLDNMLTMGSLFNGDSLMYASQYKKNQLRPDELVPPKAMLEFNRSRQENLVGKTRPRSGLGTEDDRSGQNGEGSRIDELESELKELHRMDVLLQEKSSAVSGLQKDKEMIERAINEIKVKLSNSNNNPSVEDHLTSQRILLEKDLSSTVIQLADASKQLEEATAGMVKSEEKVIHLRNKLQRTPDRDDLNGRTDQPYGLPNLRGSQRMMQLERQVEEIGNVLRGTSGQMNAINDNITSIRRSRSTHSLTRKEESSPGRTSRLGVPSYLETDLDHKTTKDTSLAVNQQNHERISRRDQVYGKSPHHDSSFARSTSIPRQINGGQLNQFQNPRDQTTRPSFHGNSDFEGGPNDRYYLSTAGSRNRDLGNPGRRTESTLQQTDGPRSADSRNSSRGRRSPYSQNSSKSTSVVKPTFNSSRGSYEQMNFQNDSTSGDNEMIFNEMTIDKALFHPPPRVQIPQRYFPDPDDTLESVDPVDIYHKQQKAEQVKKLLAIQSLQDFTLEELGRADGNIEDRIRSELKEREDILELKKNLAKQATERSRTFINS